VTPKERCFLGNTCAKNTTGSENQRQSIILTRASDAESVNHYSDDFNKNFWICKSSEMCNATWLAGARQKEELD
jgi:hypothetical protein